jgi:hypothetical protein
MFGVTVGFPVLSTSAEKSVIEAFIGKNLISVKHLW